VSKTRSTCCLSTVYTVKEFYPGCDYFCPGCYAVFLTWEDVERHFDHSNESYGQIECRIENFPKEHVGVKYHDVILDIDGYLRGGLITLRAMREGLNYTIFVRNGARSSWDLLTMEQLLTLIEDISVYRGLSGIIDMEFVNINNDYDLGFECRIQLLQMFRGSVGQFNVFNYRQVSGVEIISKKIPLQTYHKFENGVLQWSNQESKFGIRVGSEFIALKEIRNSIGGMQLRFFPLRVPSLQQLVIGCCGTQEKIRKYLDVVCGVNAVKQDLPSGTFELFPQLIVCGVDRRKKADIRCGSCGTNDMSVFTYDQFKSLKLGQQVQLCHYCSYDRNREEEIVEMVDDGWGNVLQPCLGCQQSLLQCSTCGLCGEHCYCD
jgi:hypothetical protein